MFPSAGIWATTRTCMPTEDWLTEGVYGSVMFVHA